MAKLEYRVQLRIPAYREVIPDDAFETLLSVPPTGVRITMGMNTLFIEGESLSVVAFMATLDRLILESRKTRG